MIDNSIQAEINKALKQDIDLSEEEMQAKFEKADGITEAHGVKGKASKNENRRFRRMSMNYYGTSLNLMCSLLASVDYMTKLMQEQNILLSGIYKKLEEGDKTQ